MPSENEEISRNGIPRTPQISIGVGGWAYFPLKFGNKLQICSKLYDFAEVNSTFYKLPPPERVKKWRRAVPESFEFTIRAARELTHEGFLAPTAKNFKIYDKHLEICRGLGAKVLHFQFPPSLVITPGILRGWKDFMSSTAPRRNSAEFHFSFEIRNARSSSFARPFLDEYDIIPCEDASKSERLGVSHDSKILYSRVFGLGEHTKWSFDTSELLSLEKKVRETPARKRYVTFHNITMYEDAARMKSVVKNGKDQIASGQTGLDQLKRTILLRRVKFPVSKNSLLEEFSWRTFDIEPNTKIHIGEILQRLPETQFESVEEILESIGKVASQGIKIPN